jgi:hypothetical protein
MSPHAAHAMWTAANININQQMIIKRPKKYLIIPHFRLFVMGVLAYYADATGKNGSSRNWCIWCMLQHPEWPHSDLRGIKWTAEIIDALRDKIKNNPSLLQKLRKGFKGNPLFPYFSPDQYVPHHLHLQMGLVNKALDAYLNWLDDEAKYMPAMHYTG